MIMTYVMLTFNTQTMMRKNNRQKCGQTQVHHQLELHFPEEAIRINANAIDISPGGIGLDSPKRIPVGQKVTISIGFLKDPKSTQFEAVEGTVKWCRTHGPRFTAGIEFNEITPLQHPLLSTFLKQSGPLRELVHYPETVLE
jgi:hypothetical protein